MNLILNKPNYCNNDDRICVQLLLAEILRDGRTVSIHDGEEWALNGSSDLHNILDGLASTGEDLIEVADKLNHVLGKFYLIYCNGSEGDPMICLTDYTANTFCENIVLKVEDRLSEVAIA